MLLNASPLNAVPLNEAASGADLINPTFGLLLEVETYIHRWGLSLEVVTYTLAPSFALRLAVTDLIEPAWPLRLHAIDRVALLGNTEDGGVTLLWTYRVTVGGFNLDVSDRLIGPIRILREEDHSAVMTLTLASEALINPANPAAGMGYYATMQAYYVINPGCDDEQIFLLFNGEIEGKQIDPLSHAITYTLRDARERILTEGGADLIPGSLWSAGVFDEGATPYQKMEDRLSTYPGSFQLDRVGSPTLQSWDVQLENPAPFTGGSILDGSLVVEVAPFSDRVEEVVCRFDYRYALLHLREFRVHYEFGGASLLALYPITPPSVSMVDEALEHTGMALLEATQYTTLPQQWYEFGGVWYNYPGFETMVLSATAYLGRRFAQTVTEQYELTVRLSTQEGQTAIQTEGPRRREEMRGALECAFDAAAWEADWNAAPVLDRPYLAAETLYEATDDAATGRAECVNAIETLLAKARRRILDSHRKNRFSFTTLLQPYLEVGAVISFTGLGWEVIGRVYALEHVLNPDVQGDGLAASTRITLALTYSDAAGGINSPLTAPYPPEHEEISESVRAAHQIALGTLVGGTDTSPPWDEATMQGWITNIPASTSVSGMVTSWHGETSSSDYGALGSLYATSEEEEGPSYYAGAITNQAYNAETAYPWQFRVLIPGVEEIARDHLTVSITAPNDADGFYAVSPATSVFLYTHQE